MSLQKVLASIRSNAGNERDKGTAFEALMREYLLKDPVQGSLYSKVDPYAIWAGQKNLPGQDTGIDLVARIADSDKYCAIQCKFYQENHKIGKSDIDSFMAASGTKDFARRLIIDTTNVPWGNNAEETLANQSIETKRINLADLANSNLDWSAYLRDGKFAEPIPKTAKPFQSEAVQKVTEGLKQADRGQMHLPCGTGKTYTSLLVAEQVAGKGGRVLMMVPSLALMSQVISDWTSDAGIKLRSFAVCSDSQVGKKKDEDNIDIKSYDLIYPATTKAKTLATEATPNDKGRMTVVFSTYHSADVIKQAQKKHGLPEFDLIVCDEAHRTTGANLEDDETSSFTKVHNQGEIKGKKRMYMTATPRIYAESVKGKAKEGRIELCSMDDESLYGKVLYHQTFAWAVEQGLLSDYKVVILTISEDVVSASMQRRLMDENSQLKLDDATKIIGCYKALTKKDFRTEALAHKTPVQSALAFCNTINSSKLIREQFASVIDAWHDYQKQENLPQGKKLDCEVHHIDGKSGAYERTKQLSWLKETPAKNACRILSNVRCLSEGVDVPALDAVIFMHPRKSRVDVVQALGRVMRKSPKKTFGYVILPVVIPAGMSPDEALDNNKPYQVVWQVLNALRSHDERLDMEINKMEFNKKSSAKIEIINGSSELDKGADSDPGDVKNLPGAQAQLQGALFDDFHVGVMAKIVEKCGTRRYLEDWATDVAKVAQTYITRITSLVEEEGSKAAKAFTKFHKEIQDDINGAVTKEEAVEMLAQHLITKPVFDALFKDYAFTAHNPVSKSIDKVVKVLQKQNLEKEADSLDKFYNSVKARIDGVNTDEGRQKIVVELYDKFFKSAFPRTVERLGIVYTPIEIVDFIIHSVSNILQKEFKQTLGSKNIHILDPFTGTGTFITRLIQSGLITKEQLAHKYQEELHANEIILLAYYMAAINIESAYNNETKGKYTPFPGITLCDTFDLYERDDKVKDLFPENSERRAKLKKLNNIRIIMGNPPYSARQNSANDNAANLAYPKLDQRIAETYVANTIATNKNALYDSYIRAIRWSSDRITQGIICLVTNAGWLNGNATDGMRKCLAEEFSSIYIFHLRGDIRKNILSKGAAQEGENVFGQASMTGVAILLLVKDPEATKTGQIFFYDIGDNIKCKEKLDGIRELASIDGITAAPGWTSITPDKYHDWLKHRDAGFEVFLPMGAKKDKTATAIFANYSNGLKTQRDAWCYNFSHKELASNMCRMIKSYNNERSRYHASRTSQQVKNFVDSDPSKISWSRALVGAVQKDKEIGFSKKMITPSLYRPFTRSLLYYDRALNEMMYQIPSIFPTGHEENRLICVTGIGARTGFSCLMVDTIPNLHTLDSGQCFPRFLYDTEAADDDLLSSTQATPRRDAINDEALTHFQKAYQGKTLSKDDLFYYIYGLLHSPDYRSRFANNLSKQLPHIPCVKTHSDFCKFSEAGRKLANIHLNFERVKPHPVKLSLRGGSISGLTDDDYKVTKMKLTKKGDLTTVSYNHKITITNIPPQAWEYVISGKPALKWIMERQSIMTDKDSGIINNCNLYAAETKDGSAYPLKLFQRIITVSLRTQEIVHALPPLKI